MPITFDWKPRRAPWELRSVVQKTSSHQAGGGRRVGHGGGDGSDEEYSGPSRPRARTAKAECEGGGN